jgi:predicted GIY-YIG superfamily endonuclease
MKSNWYVYICKANTGRYYTGISTDPKERLKSHNSDHGARFARDQGPFELLYVSSPFSSKSMARLREIQIKGWSRYKKENLISGKWV